jgi:DNA-binding transcriptional LysR family regulator
MRELNDLSLFAAVVANGGFTAASKALGTPKSRISRRVAALEDSLSVRLLERSTRRFKVTEVGQEVYRHARAALTEAEAIDEVVLRMRGEPQGLVRVSCVVGLDRVLAAALPGFLDRYPKLRLEVIVSNRRVDLIEEGVDIAIGTTEHLDTNADFQVRTIAAARAILVASPDFVAKHGTPDAPEDIPRFPTVSHTDFSRHRWRLTNSAGETVEIAHQPRVSASAFPILRQAAIDGIGIARLPEEALHELRADGRLVRILPHWGSTQGALHLVFTSRRGLLPGVRAFIDFAVEALNPRLPGFEAIL